MRYDNAYKTRNFTSVQLQRLECCRLYYSLYDGRPPFREMSVNIWSLEFIQNAYPYATSTATFLVGIDALDKVFIGLG